MVCLILVLNLSEKTTGGLAGKIFPRTNGRYNGGCRQANYMLVIFTLRPAGR
jgi:hypothetical protein